MFVSFCYRMVLFMSSHSNCFWDELGLPRLAKRTGSWRTGLGHLAERLPKTAISLLIPIVLKLFFAPPLDTGISHQNVPEPGLFAWIPFAVDAPTISGTSVASG